MAGDTPGRSPGARAGRADTPTGSRAGGKGRSPLKPPTPEGDGVQKVMAKCGERCGWTGEVRTGWVDAGLGWLERAGVPLNRRRERGGQWQYRRRLRDAACPGCGSVGLDRCERL